MKEQLLAEGNTARQQKFQFKNPIPILQEGIAEIDSVKRIEKCIQGLQIISDAFHQEEQLEQILQQHELIKLLLIVKYIAGSQVDMILDFIMGKYIKNSDLIDAIFKACTFFSTESEKNDFSLKDCQQNQIIIQQGVYYDNKEDVKQLQYRHINKIYFTEIIQNNIIEIKQMCFDYSLLVIESFLQKKFTDQQVIDGVINIYLQFYDFTQNESIKQRVKQLLVKYKQDYPWILQNKFIRIKVYRILGINKKQKSLDNAQSPQLNSNQNLKSENKSSNFSNLSSYQTSDLDGEEDEGLDKNEDLLQTCYSEDNKQFSLIIQKQKPITKTNQNDHEEKLEEKVRSQSFEEKSPTTKGKNKSIFFAQDDSSTSSPKGSPSKNAQQGAFEDFKSATFSLKLQKTPSNKLLKLEQKVQSSPTVHKIQKQKEMGSQKIEEWIINSSKEDLVILKNEQAKATFKSNFSLSLVILFLIKPKDMPLNKELLRKEEMKGVIFEAAVGFRRSLAEMFAARPWEINSYIFRSFKAMEFLLIYENFEYLLRFNNVVEMFFEELNKVMLNGSCCNYNHVANCIEFFLKYVPEMTLIEITKYNILYHLIGFFDYPQVQRLFYLLFNINYKNENPVHDHLLKKFWEYTQTTYLFRELLTMMLFCDLKKLRKMYKEEYLQSKPTSDIISYFTQQRKKLKDFESLKVYNKSVAEEEFGFAVDIDKIKVNIVKSRMSVLKGAFSRGLIQIPQNSQNPDFVQTKQAQAQKKKSISSKRSSTIQNNQTKQILEAETSHSQTQPDQSQHIKMLVKGNKNVKKLIQQNQQQMKFSDIVEIAKSNKEKIIQTDNNLKILDEESNKNEENSKKLQNQQDDKRKNQKVNSKRTRSTSKNIKNDNLYQSFAQKNLKETNSKLINKTNDSTISNTTLINSVANQKRRSISESNLSSLKCKTESSQISNKFLPEITLNQSFFMKMQKKEEVSDSIKKLSQKEQQLLKTVKIVNQNGVNKVMPQLFNVKLLNKQESYLSDLNKLSELYPAQNDFFYNQSQNDVLAEQTYFSLDSLIQNDIYSYTIAQFIFNLLRNIIQEESEQDIFKLLNLKTFDYEHLLDCIVFSDQQYNLFEYIMKNYIFKLKIHPITPENSAFVCGKMINWFLSNSNHKLLQKFKEQINLVAKRHFKILCKLIINSYGWKSKKSDSFLKLQKDQLIDQPIGSARLLLLETLYLIIKEETEHKVEMIEFIPETCWNALFNFFFNDKNNTVYQAKFFQFYQECLQYFKMHTFFSIWIKLNYIQNLVAIHENIHQHDSLKFYLKNFILSILQLIEEKHIEMSSLSQILSSSESWKIISKPYIQNQLSSIPSLQELNTTKQGFKKSVKSFSKFKDEDKNSLQKLISQQNVRSSSSSEKQLPSEQKSHSSEQFAAENKIKSSQQNLKFSRNIEKSQIIKQIANSQKIIKVNSDQSESVVKRLDEKANKIIQMAWQNTVFFNQVMTKKKNQIDFEEMPFLKK